MTKISFLNDKFLPHNQAFIHIDDRSIQFADSVYEVTLFNNNRLIDGEEHWQRLEKSLAKLNMKMPYDKQKFTELAHELFAQNNITIGSLYIQVTRGVAARNQLLPKNIPQTVIMTANSFKIPQLDPQKVNKVLLEPDIRWSMCDVKSTGLLIGSMYKQKAHDNECEDVIMHRNGIITECCFSNIFIVKNHQLITHPTNNLILAGITRARVIKIAKQFDIPVIEKEFSLAELVDADEVFSTSTTTFVRPIHVINGQNIADAKTGNISMQLYNQYVKYISET